MALRLGLELALTVGCHRVDVSADNMELIRKMRDRVPSSTFAVAVYDDWFVLSMEFARLEFDHCPHESQPGCA